MARLVEDSEDEFPDLGDILKSSDKQTSSKKVASTLTSRMLRTTKITHRESETKTGAKLVHKVKQNPEQCGSEMASKEGSDVVEAVKGAKKRVLIQQSDNPLLQPISTGRSKNDQARPLAIRSGPETMSRKKGPKSKCSELRGRKSSFDEESDDNDGMSDFVVNDSCTSEEDNSLLDVPPPKSVRRLVRGRRQAEDESEEKGLESKISESIMKDEEVDMFGVQVADALGRIKLERDSPDFETPAELRAQRRSLPDVGCAVSGISSDSKDPVVLQFSPSKSTKFMKPITFKTPPPSPEKKPKGLVSPKKIQRIPMTPHRPSMDSFWDQETTNAWNDEFSPRKMPNAHPRNLFSHYANSLENVHTLAGTSPAKNEKLARQAKKVFSKQKHELAQSFLAELDNAITDGKLAKLAAATGGIKITWSKKLNTTAGRANWKRETIRPCSRGPENSSASLYRHHAEIELAEKVIDDEKRLLNVIAHEFCHLANFMVSNIKTNPHGKEFKAWAAKCSAHFGERGIEVTTKHSYTIEYKYVWECTNCGVEFKRHSKSIDAMKHQCGNCKSKLVQTKPAPRTGSGKATEYQNFVKENMGKIKAGNPKSPQKEILGLVAKKYQEVKATKMREEERHGMSLQSISKEASPDDDDGIGTISRELNFLDLTSS